MTWQIVGWALFAVALTAGAVIVLFAVLVGLGMDPFGDEPAPGATPERTMTGWTIDEGDDLVWTDVEGSRIWLAAADLHRGALSHASRRGAHAALVQAVRDADTLAKGRGLIQARASSGLLDGLAQDLLDLLTKGYYGPEVTPELTVDGGP